jgi:hypothetical protein
MTNSVGWFLTFQVAFSLLPAFIGTPQEKPRSIDGVYQNYALGFSIKIPHGLKGIASDEAGPERGTVIPLSSGGKITAFGEPNSLEWKNPDEGINHELASEACASAKPKISGAHTGKLMASKGSLVCGDRVLILMLVFRPKGGPIYWLRLETNRSHRAEDEAVFQTAVASFKLIAWG